MNDLINFIRTNPKLFALLVFIGALAFYQQYLKEQMANPQKKEKTRRPKLPRTDQRKAHGIIFGRRGKKVYYSPIEDECHVFCCASSGAGKTSALAIPSIRASCTDPKKGACFCIDISGDISTHCDIPNKLVFDVEDPDTIPYDIFSAIDKEPKLEIKNEMLEKLAFLIMPDMSDLDDAGRFFLSNGRRMLIGALIAYYHQGHDFVQICKKIISMDYQTLLYDIVDAKNEDAIHYIASFSGANEKNSAGCKQCMDGYIGLYANNFRMEKALRRPREGENAITPQLLKDHNLFLCIPDHKTDIYGPLLGVCTAQALDYCASRENGEAPTILFVLDEFASLRISASETAGTGSILAAVRKYRKKNVRLMIITQALIDLDILYGQKTRDAILNNIRYKVILGITDPQSQRYFADIIGQKEVRTKSSTIGDNHCSTSYSTRREYRVPPEEFGQLRTHLYLICDDGSYQKLEKNYYFKYDKS